MADPTFADRAEQFLSDLMREQYQVSAGSKPTLELAPIYKRNADLFAEATVRERIMAMKSDESSKVARHLADFAVGSFIENAVKELSEQITNAELHAVVEWDGKQIPYQDVRAVLVHELSMLRRHDLFAKQNQVMVKQNPMRVQRINAQHDLARNLGFASYRAMVEELRRWNLPELAKQLKPLLDETEDVYEENLERHLSDVRVPRKDAETSDVAFVLRAPQFDSIFPVTQLVPSFVKTLKGLGLELATTPGLTLDTEARPLKSPRAFCAPVRVPKEVYLVIKPIGGQDDYRAFYHESGHAEHFSHIDEALPFALRYLGDEAISETFAFLFESLTYSPRWLVDVLRIPVRDAEKYRRFALFNKLWLLRRYVAKLQYEIHLHDNGPVGLEADYREILTDALRVKIPPERFLDDVDDAFYVAGYLRAWVFEVQLRRFVMQKFGEGWYETPEAGTFLQSLWSVGLRDSVEEIAQTRIGAEKLNPTPLMEELVNL